MVLELVLLAPLSFNTLLAQSGASTIQRTVRDSSGAVITAAMVVPVAVSTNRSREAECNSAGFFFPGVYRGLCKLTVQAAGMQDSEATPETQAGHVAIVDPDVVTAGTATHITVACGLIAPIHVENGMVSARWRGSGSSSCRSTGGPSPR